MPKEKTIDDRRQKLLDQLELPTLTQSEIDTIQRKLELLESQESSS